MYGTSRGAVYVLYGGPESSFSPLTLPATLDPLTTGFTITRNTANDYFGFSVSTAGDLNNDNYDDIIIGANRKDSERGMVYVIYGGPKSSLPNLDFTSPTLNPLSNGFTVQGNANGDYFGYSMSATGDINNDNYDDIIIGAQVKSGGKGGTYLVHASKILFYSSF